MAEAWAAIGILTGAVLGTLFYLGSRIDALAGRLDGRIDAVSAELRDLRAEMRDLRVDLTSRLDEHIRRHAG